MIGKIHAIQLENGLVMPDGFIDLHKAATVCSNGIDSYYETKPLGRLSYAKPGLQPALKVPYE